MTAPAAPFVPVHLTVVANDGGQAILISDSPWPDPLPASVILGTDGRRVTVRGPAREPLGMAPPDSFAALMLARELFLGGIRDGSVVSLRGVAHSWE